jgi:hypothetical protein
MPCHTSENVVCKHVRANKTYYADLSFLPEGVTVVSATAETEDDDLVVVGAEVLETDLTPDECGGNELKAGRTILVRLSDGSSSDDEVIVTVCWVDSEGESDCRDVRVLVGGAAA